MKNKMKWILSVALLCGTVAPVAAMDLDDKAGMEEVRKRSGIRKKVSPVRKTVVKNPRRDFGPGLVGNN